MDTDTLTTEDLEFLARPLHGFLTVAGSPQPAQPRPVWFEATTDGTVQLFTPSNSVKLRRLRRDPRASIVVAAPIGERERWVSVTGRATVEDDGARELAVRLAARYWDLDERADDPRSRPCWSTTAAAHRARVARRRRDPAVHHRRWLR